MTGSTRRLGLLAVLFLVMGGAYAGLKGCQSAALLNAMVPNDRNSRKAATDIAYGAHPRQQLDIYVPKDAQGLPQPVLVFIHGGGWHSGEKRHYSFAGHAFAASGFVTLLVNYRLVPGADYPDFLDDTAAALAWARENVAGFGGDPDKIFVMGHSAGAYNAVMMALAPEFLGHHQMKPADLAGVIGWSGPYDFLPLDTASTIAAFSTAPDPAATQPIDRARALPAGADLPPIYLMHGRDDTAVGLYHTERLTDALRQKNVKVVPRLYDGIDHTAPIIGIARPFRGRSQVFADTISFLREHSHPELQ